MARTGSELAARIHRDGKRFLLADIDAAGQTAHSYGSLLHWATTDCGRRWSRLLASVAIGKQTLSDVLDHWRVLFSCDHHFADGIHELWCCSLDLRPHLRIVICPVSPQDRGSGIGARLFGLDCIRQLY